MEGSQQLAVNTPDQYVQWQQGAAGPLSTVRIGTQDQFYLHTQGDDVRIDWASPTWQRRRSFRPMSSAQTMLYFIRLSQQVGCRPPVIRWYRGPQRIVSR